MSELSERKWKCPSCGMIITTFSGTPPNEIAGGPCPKNPKKTHNWVND